MEQKTHPSRELSDSIKNLRANIVNTTTDISTQASGFTFETLQLQTDLLEGVSKFTERIESKRSKVGDKLPIESLYEKISPSSESTKILSIIRILNKYNKYLVSALENFKDEATRENEMMLFRPIVFELDYLNLHTDNLIDIATMMKVALLSKDKEPYSREQIIALKNSIFLIKNNINIPDNIKDNIIDYLDNNFDLSVPLEKAETLE